MRIKLPPKVKMVLDSLEAAGYEAYAVGGCVRDSILNRKPQDWDITTSALPQEVKRIFRRTIDTGIQHGTVTVLVDDAAFEVTTYRIDGTYEDGRHPKDVTFTRSLEEDLKRRDFTINAMAYSESSGLVDLFGGMNDLQRKVIRCVGNPEERFQEDALRILRAVRFSAQMGFFIDRGTIEAIEKLSPTLSRISAERICAELTKLIVSGHPEYLEAAYEMGITKVILPEFDAMMETPQINRHHYLNVGEHTLVVMENIPAERVLRYAALLHDVGKPRARKRDRYGVDHFKGHDLLGEGIARSVMQRLKMDNDTIRNVTALVRYHDWRINPDEKNVRRAAARVGTELFPSLMKLQVADCMGQEERYRDSNLERINRVWDLYRKIIEEKQCISLKELAVDGTDLIAAGYRPGKDLGDTLKGLLEAVLEDPERNRKEVLLEMAEEHLRHNPAMRDPKSR